MGKQPGKSSMGGTMVLRPRTGVEFVVWECMGKLTTASPGYGPGSVGLGCNLARGEAEMA